MSSYLENSIPKNDIDFFLVSSHSQDWDLAQTLIRFAAKKMPTSTIIVGGHHITQLPECLPAEANFGIRGEGELTLPKLLCHIVEENHCLNSLESIPGIIYRNVNGMILSNPPERVPFDLLPLPDRTACNGSRTVPYMLTSRGCPYHCIFCSSTSVWSSLSEATAETIADELQQITREFPSLVKFTFWDDLFIANRSRLRNLIVELNKRNLLEKLTFSCNVRANLVDNELCNLLNELKIQSVGFGFESGCDRILKQLKPEGNMSVDKNIAAIELLAKNNINIVISSIIGIPGETEDELISTFEITLRLMKINVIEYTAYNILTPFPGTKIWKRALYDGLVSESNNFKWSKLKYYTDYSVSSFTSFDSWAYARMLVQSVYMNEQIVPYKYLLKYIKAMGERRKIILDNRVHQQAP
jgi:radical SAM superfamily enzyme YgiQ (UPF0313 family)